MFTNSTIPPVTARIEGEVLTDQDIKNMELVRAQIALNYLKDKIGGDAIQKIIKEEVDLGTKRVEAWLDASNGEWKSGFVLLEMPNITGKEFIDWFSAVIEQGDDRALRVAHPEHFLNHITPKGVQIIEKVGEDEYPWHVFGVLTPITDNIPVKADASYPLGFVTIANNVNGKVVVYAVQEFKDRNGVMEVKLTIALPKAVPDALIRGHLNHFSIEFRNWYRTILSSKKAIN
jgi:hypothetical protein